MKRQKPVGYAWRPLAPGDGPALAELAERCAAVDGNPHPGTAALFARRLETRGITLAQDTLAALADEALVAYGWVTFDASFPDQRRAYLEGCVDPAQRSRGLGDMVLSWSERRAETELASPATTPAGGTLHRPGILRIDTYDEHNKGAYDLYERHGFGLVLAEDDMRRELEGPIARPQLAAGLRWANWDGRQAHKFHTVYVDAFRTRPGFQSLSGEAWQAHYAGFPTFRADLSWLLSDGEDPVGYALAAIEEPEDTTTLREGWIVQMGVRVAWRRRGLGAALLNQTLHGFRAEGLPYAMLSVNVNNPQAMALYQQLGFVRTRRTRSYRRELQRRQP